MIQEHGDGDGNITIGQSHARMLLNWHVAAEARDSGTGRESEGMPAGGEVLNINNWKWSYC